MSDDLEEIHFTLRITLDVVDLLRAIEKYFGGNANYAKGKGSMFMNWMQRWHPTAFLFGVSRACGGSRQDIGVEGAIAVIMNIPFYLEFLVWRMRCGHDGGILERNLFMMLRSIEVVSFLRVLAILHISVCMPLRWLAANCGELSAHKFGVAEMANVVDIMDKAFNKVVTDGSKMMNEKFMMDMFSKLTRKIPPFADYLTYMFSEKRSNLVGPCTKEERVLPWEMVRSEMFYPTRVDLIETTTFVPELASHAGAIFRAEFRDKTKATHKYLSAIGGKQSIKKIKKAQRLAGRGVDASNSVSESGHAGLGEDLDRFGTIDMQHCAAAPQSRFNNDFGREFEGYIKGRKSMSATKSRGIGGFHLLMTELAFTAMVTAKWGTDAHREAFKEEKQIQEDERREKEEIALKHGIDIAKEEYIDAIYMFQKYHSARRWRNKKEALEIFSKILKEGPRREAVKVSAISGLQIYT
jgi:hypothetical protein